MAKLAAGAIILALLGIVWSSAASLDLHPEVIEFRITDNLAEQSLPDVSGDIVLWQDSRSGEFDKDIYGYRLSTRTEFPIVSTSSRFEQWPSISGNTIVFVASRSLVKGVYSLDLPTKVERPIHITEVAGVSYEYPSVSARIVGWRTVLQQPSLNYRIDAYDLQTGELHSFSGPFKSTFSAPAADGTMLVWSLGSRDPMIKPSGIYGYDFVSAREFLIAATSGASAPWVSGNIVVWQDNRNGNWDIYGYDLAARSEFRMTTNPSDQMYPRISGGIVVWQDNRNGNWDIYGYDLRTRTEFPITTAVGDQQSPAISGNIVVWQDNRHGNWDIYGADLSPTPSPTPTPPPPPPPAPTATPTETPTPAPTPTPTAGDLLTVTGFAWYDDNSNGILDGEEEPAAATLTVFSGTWGGQGRQPHRVVEGGSGGDGRFAITFFRPSETPVWVEARALRPGFPTRPELNYNYIVRTLALDFSRTATLSINLGLRPGFPFYPRPPDYPIPGGHFYTQANGRGGEGGTGYSITDDPVAPFWSEFGRLGEVPQAGYPASRRFLWDGFVSQVMQKQVFQWRPEAGQVYFVNTFDELSRAGKDPWLLAFRQVPPPFDTSPDSGLSWDEVVRRHLAFLDSDPAIKARYFADADPIAHFGLPMSYADFGNVFVMRGQRAVLQHWKVDTPWARAGEVTIANGGDILKEAGLVPAEAAVPEPPPG